MIVLGITGGVATGKSAVTQMLGDLGAPTVSADSFARDLLAPGSPTSRAVLAQFPDCALDGQADAVNRRALARRVFDDPEARIRLEALTHPPIIAALESAVAAWRHADGIAAAEVPLLFEAGLEGLFDRIVVAACDEAAQIVRLAERLNGSEESARKMMAAQWPLPQKIACADDVIDTGESLEETRRQVAALWQRLT